ncbi:V-type ATP synthase subunit F [Clostridiaceae bacterium 35-E11]
MASYLISDNQDTLIGMRLAGIKGVLAQDKKRVLDALKCALGDENIEIIIITEKILFMAEEEIMKLKIERARPLIIEIPDRSGSQRGEYLIKRIRESIGLKI